MGGKTLTRECFIERAIKKHGNKYIYTEFVYLGIETKGILICRKHGRFEQTPHSHLKGANCPECVNEKRRKTNEEFISKSKLIYEDKYTYNETNYTTKRRKICITCPKHGNFYQYPDHHLSGQEGCRTCFKESLRVSREYVIEKFKKVHGDEFDYSEFRYTDNTEKSIIICKKHGRFLQSYHDHCYCKAKCPECSHTISKGEMEFVRFLKRENKSNNILVCQLDEMYRYFENKLKATVDGKFKPDLFIVDKNNNIMCLVEYDGIFWHGDFGNPDDIHPIIKKPMKYLKDRTNKKIQRIKKYGIDVKNIVSSEWDNFIKNNIVSGKIKELFQLLGIKC